MLVHAEGGDRFFSAWGRTWACRMQNAHGHVLGHVRDLGKSSSDPNVRIYQLTNARAITPTV